MKLRSAMVAGGLALMSAAPGIAASAPSGPPKLLENANVLPLALDDSYQFRKVQEFLNEPRFERPTQDAMVAYERNRVNWGVINNNDRLETRGHYYNFYWRTRKPGAVTVRFEYRQANLGSYVQAREVSYPFAKGTTETRFQVIGDDYNIDGRVIAWRAVLIAGGKIVGLTQSYLWN